MGVVLQGVLTVLGAILLTIVMLLLVRRLPVASQFKDTNDIAGVYLNIVGAIYAVLLALMFFAVWNRYELAEDTCAQEASALVDIYQIAGGLSEPERVQVQTACRNYADLVIQKEFPEMKVNSGVAVKFNVIADLNRTLTTLNPYAAHDQMILGQIMSRYADMVKNRNSRLHKSESDIPSILWFLMIMGEILLLGLSCLFWMENFWLHVVKACTLSAVVALIMFIMWSIDDPFGGGDSITAHDFIAAEELFTATFRPAATHARNTPTLPNVRKENDNATSPPLDRPVIGVYALTGAQSVANASASCAFRSAKRGGV